MNNDTRRQKSQPIDFSGLQAYKLDIEDGLLFYLPNWLSLPQAESLYVELKHELCWSQDQVFVYGKWHDIPRLQAWYGDSDTGYQYSGKTLTPLPWTPGLQMLRHRIEALGLPINSVLANWYRNGLDKMGWHSDNEKELGAEPAIASVSLGSTRSFHLKHKSTGQRINLELSSGSLLVMAGTMQAHWQHALPQRKRVEQGRINLTFRHVQQAR